VLRGRRGYWVRLGVLVGAGCLAAARKAHGAVPEPYAVTLGLDPPAGTVNRLDVAVEAEMEGWPFPLRDDDQVSATGFLRAVLDLEIDAGGATAVPRRFSFEEGSRLQFSDTDLRLPRLFPLVRIRTRSLEATVTTPDGPREIRPDGSFDTLGVFVVLDRGTLEITGSLVEEPVAVDFAAEPAPVTGPGEGSVQMVPASVRPDSVDYRVTMSIPLDLVLDVPDDIPPPAADEIPEGLTGSFSMAGLIRAQGQFRWFPPPDAPQLELVPAAEGDEVVLRFEVKSGLHYAVEQRSLLGAGAWRQVLEQIAEQDGVVGLTLPTVEGASSFRVLVDRR